MWLAIKTPPWSNKTRNKQVTKVPIKPAIPANLITLDEDVCQRDDISCVVMLIFYLKSSPVFRKATNCSCQRVSVSNPSPEGRPRHKYLPCFTWNPPPSAAPPPAEDYNYVPDTWLRPHCYVGMSLRHTVSSVALSPPLHSYPPVLPTRNASCYFRWRNRVMLWRWRPEVRDKIV